jgi:hypothetical protein
MTNAIKVLLQRQSGFLQLESTIHNSYLYIKAAKLFFNVPREKNVVEAACGRADNLEDVKVFRGQAIHNIFVQPKICNYYKTNLFKTVVIQGGTVAIINLGRQSHFELSRICHKLKILSA